MWRKYSQYTGLLVKKADQHLENKLRRVELLVLDVDGVLSDGRIYISDDGREIKAFDARDGLAIVALKRRGVEVAVISGRYSRAVEIRCSDLGVELLFQDVSDKLDVLKKILKQCNLSPESAAAMGDDINDISMMKYCGVCATVPEAHPAVLEVADYVTSRAGGRGAVREFSELIMKAKGMWKY